MESKYVAWLAEKVKALGIEDAVVSWEWCREGALCFGLAPRVAEALALRNGFCPDRYERKIGTLGHAGQEKLLACRVAVVGCGGIGGWLVELLARQGFGQLVLIDGDVFAASNLNRQLLCREADIGVPKARAAAARVAAINSAVETVPRVCFLDDENARELLDGCDLVLDALDSIGARKIALRACADLGIPFVHAAIAGFYAQLAVFWPHDPTPWDHLDDSPEKAEKGIEVQTGNPGFTPAFVAAQQVAEATKIICGLGNVLRGKLLWFNLLEGTRQEIAL